MSRASLLQAFRSVTLPPVYNWKEDSQPERHTDPKTYREIAKALTEPSLHFAVNVLRRAGYIEPGQEDTVLERLTTLKPGSKLELDGVSICWRVKGQKAIDHKKSNDGKEAEDIGDYFGMKFIANDVSDVVRLRDAILQSDNMTSRKCEFTEPSREGFRSHKSHHTISDGKQSLSIEAMITHAAFEQSDKLTHTIMEYERNLGQRQEALSDKQRNGRSLDIREIKLAAEFSASVDRLRSERTYLNNLSAAAAGLDQLCGPDVIKFMEPEPMSKYTRRMLAGLNPDLQDQRDRILRAQPA